MSICLVGVLAEVTTLGITMTGGESRAAVVEVIGLLILNFEPTVTLSLFELDSSHSMSLLHFTLALSTPCVSFLIGEIGAALGQDCTSDTGILAGCLNFTTGIF